MQHHVDAKVSNLLGDERMTCMACHCGAVYDRMGTHKKQVLGFQCRHCLTNWRTHAEIANNGQATLFFEYYECKCGSNILNIPPKNTRCICPIVDLR